MMQRFGDDRAFHFKLRPFGLALSDEPSFEIGVGSGSDSSRSGRRAPPDRSRSR
jgi:hypothetical protein